MARNDLELGAEWVAQTTDGVPASVERKMMVSEAYARLLADERDVRVGLDAVGHRQLAEYREALRRLATSS